MVVYGVSKLVVDFCTRAARPNKAELFLAVREIQAIVK